MIRPYQWRPKDPWRVTWTRWVWIKSRITAFILRCRIAGGWLPNWPLPEPRELDQKIPRTEVMIGCPRIPRDRYVPTEILDWPTEKVLDAYAAQYPRLFRDDSGEQTTGTTKESNHQ